MKGRWLYLAALLILLLPLPSLAAIQLNDLVVVSSAASPYLNVRQTPSATGTVIGTMTPDSPGLVLSGPQQADNVTWYQVQWISPNITGWSSAQYLIPQPPSYQVYSNFNLLAGWRVLQWSNTGSNTNNTSTYQSASSSIAVTASAAYARLYARSNDIGFNTSGYQTLKLSLRTGASGQQLYIAIYDTSGQPRAQIPAWEYVPGANMAPNTWYNLAIPLSSMQAQNMVAGGVVVEIESAGTFYVDDVSFDTALSSTYYGGSTITSVSASCASPVGVNQPSQCSATVSGTNSPSQAVTWTASAGTINTSTGLLTAPGSPTTVIVTARSVQDTSKSGLTNVTVNSGTSQASNVAFDETFGTGWNLGSWNQVTVDTNAAVPFSGDKSMRVQISTSAWGRVKLQTNSGVKFNTTGYAVLRFGIRMEQLEGVDLYVALLDATGDGIHYVTLTNYNSNRNLDPYRWYGIQISLADLAAANADVYGVEIQSATPRTFFLDEVKFEQNGVCQ